LSLKCGVVTGNAIEFFQFTSAKVGPPYPKRVVQHMARLAGLIIVVMTDATSRLSAIGSPKKEAFCLACRFRMVENVGTIPA
jgi:hypothetical protein